eukprot:4418_1
MSNYINVYALFILFISTTSQSITPTNISNSTHEYYISQRDGDFNSSAINCTSDTLCHIECNHADSCKGININCNSSELCIIDCKGSNTCEGINIYNGHMKTNINCVGYRSCYVFGSWTTFTTIYTDFSHYPSSHTVLRCEDTWSCNGIRILDVISGSYTPYTNTSQITIYCGGTFGGCNINGISPPYPLAIADIMNATGEYYINVPSKVTINCTNNLLCSIDCGGGGCDESYISCGNADICMVSCNGYDNSKPCADMDITANNINLFQFECTNWGSWACQDANFHIHNVDTVNIKCRGDSWKCQGSNFQIKNVNNLHIECDGTWSCPSTTWNIDNITNNISIPCVGGCDDAIFNINNSHFTEISCIGSYEPCGNMKLNGYSNEEDFQINLHCMNDEACNDLNVCMNGKLIADCCGDYSCNKTIICETMSRSLLKQNCNCGGKYTCQNLNIFETTDSPTDITSLKPTQLPSVAPNTGISTTESLLSSSVSTDTSKAMVTTSGCSGKNCDQNKTDKYSMGDKGIVISIVIIVVVMACIGVLLGFLCWRRNKNQHRVTSNLDYQKMEQVKTTDTTL